MLVIAASHLGMCFGVRDALAQTRNLQHPAQITINGQLVHNPLVNHELAARGFSLAEESGENMPQTPAVLITAHGISNRERARFQDAGKTLIDTTCPLVKKAHDAALRLQTLGFHVLVIAKRRHVETRGLTGDLESFDILESPADVRRWPHPKLGIIAQTTSIERHARDIVDTVMRMNPAAHIRFINTICQPTRDRQLALESLLQQIDILVAVGGRNSNNTVHLVRTAAEHNIPAVHVESAHDLHPGDFLPDQIVGLTAGTSTLPETIDEVRDRLESMFVLRQSAIEIQKSFRG